MGFAVSLLLLVAADFWGADEVWRLIFDHSHHGGILFWIIFLVVVLFYVGLIRLTVRVAKRPRARSAGSS
jgi:divalent metal cation (Fe/Co/Zn/Cd) transporter